MKKALTKRQQQARETRAKIIDVALKLFNEYGFQNVSMEMIAEQAQVSIGAIYHYFKSKEEIAVQTLSVLDEQYAEFFAELHSDKQYADMSPLEKLKAFFVFVQVKSSEQGWLNYAYIYDLKNLEGKIVRVNKERGIYQCYSDLLDDCKRSGDLKENTENSKYIAVFTQTSRGLLIDWLLNGKGFNIETQAKELIEIVIKGIKSID